ncbi:hypothetical protein ACFFK0_25890 [Paenibacillus chartarius]|uniref:Uncharacterized protein n=1 Tax=Paenibacillus chartarius TaxID=747481 RepID=A0ABV6DTD4_9BACL
MLLHGRSFKQLGNLGEERTQVELEYSDEYMFYKLLDEAVDSLRHIIITFPNEKLNEDSKLVARLSSCRNGDDIALRLFELLYMTNESLEAAKTQNIQKLIENYKKAGEKAAYSMYTVNYEFNKQEKGYIITLTAPPTDKKFKLPSLLA